MRSIYRVLIVPLVFVISSCNKDLIPEECPCMKPNQIAAMYKGCEEIDDYDDRWKCTSQMLLKDVYATARYPEAARRDTIQGTVAINIHIDEFGHAYYFESARKVNLGYGIEEEALRVARLISEDGWCPARENCKPIKSIFTLPILFKLK